MRLPKTMPLWLLSCVVPLTGCASADAAPPAEMLTCAPAPEVPEAETQRPVAAYLVDLWDAGEDCRQRLGAVRELFDEPQS